MKGTVGCQWLHVTYVTIYSPKWAEYITIFAKMLDYNVIDITLYCTTYFSNFSAHGGGGGFGNPPTLLSQERIRIFNAVFTKRYNVLVGLRWCTGEDFVQTGNKMADINRKCKCKCKEYYLLAEPYDRVMQLNWLYFCGIYQLIPLKLWPNTAQGCNHQSTCMPQLHPLCSPALVPNVLPRRDEGSGKPCAVIEAS